MAAGDATAADVPAKYDVVINGKGYCLLDSVEESIPFRTHRASYGFTPTFVQRQNITGAYGDNQQDFFFNIRQNDFSSGEQQRFYKGGAARYWAGSKIDVRTPGKASLRADVQQVAGAGTSIVSMCGPAPGLTYDSFYATATNVYQISATGSTTNLGAHGLAGTPRRYGMTTDSSRVYVTDGVSIRKWDGAAWSTFSASGADQLSFMNNTLFGFRIGNGDLVRWDTGGVLTSLFPWKNADGSVRNGVFGGLVPYGGKMAILWSNTDHTPELWMYDGVGVSLVQTLPANFFAYDLCVQFGIIFISGGFCRENSSGFLDVRPAVFYWANGSLGILWQTTDYYNTGVAFAAAGGIVTTPLFSCVAAFDGGVVWNDDSTGTFLYYDAANGGIQSIGAYTVTGLIPLMYGGARAFTFTRGNQNILWIHPYSQGFVSSGYVKTSLFDFDSSLKKAFRGVTVEFDAGPGGNGGSVDVSYQLDSVDGAYTGLATGVTSGTEINFPAATTGHSVSLLVTLNKGTSTSGPVLKSVTVRGAPILPPYAHGEYTIDCTGTRDNPRDLRDGSPHPLSGYQQMSNLVSAAKSTAPITITDKANGTFTGMFDTNDPQGFNAYEVHPYVDDKTNPGSYVVQVTVRGV